MIATAANKIDLLNSTLPEDEEERKFDKEIKSIFQYTSARTYESIDELYQKIGLKLLQNEQSYNICINNCDNLVN